MSSLSTFPNAKLLLTEIESLFALNIQNITRVIKQYLAYKLVKQKPKSNYLIIGRPFVCPSLSNVHKVGAVVDRH